ncbi:hypothetical protein WOLCODRAFT_26832, partial [Wolfiporia cocos MD-104 SS10]
MRWDTHLVHGPNRGTTEAHLISRLVPPSQVSLWLFPVIRRAISLVRTGDDIQAYPVLARGRQANRTLGFKGTGGISVHD